jgi:hypothetical protein
MRTLTILTAAGLALAAMAAPADAQRTTPPPGPRLIDDVKYLADQQLEGRLTGSTGADSAAEFIARRFAQAGLQPPPGGWFQEFTVAREAPAAQHARVAGVTGRNVIGILPGSDPALRLETVIVGAHYDHLGHGGFGALDPDSAGSVHNGADDNASGTAALFHIAAQLAARPPARTVVFIAFDGEELGLIGSGHYTKNPIYPLAGTLAMINLDMVGRLTNNRLIVYGTGTAEEFPRMLDSLNWFASFDLREVDDGYGPSDQSSFYAAKRPVLHIFTDLHEDYHRATDDWDKINLDGLKRVVDFTAGVATALANRPTPLTFVDLPPPAVAHGTEGPVTRGYGAYLGSIPDMAGTPGGGVRLTGVRNGSPADAAGLRAGDVITLVGTHQIQDLQALTNALRAHAPGDVVALRFRRDGADQTVSVTLGSRGE